MITKQSPPRGQPAAGNVFELRQLSHKYPPSSIEAQGCFSCGTTFDLTSSGRCRTCLAFVLHYRACCVLREVQS